MARKKSTRRTKRKGSSASAGAVALPHAPSNLSDREIAILDAFVECGVGKEAMLRVDPSVKFPAQVFAYLYAKPAAQEYVSNMRDAARRDTISTVAEIAQRHTTIARAVVGDYLTEFGTIDLAAVRDPVKGLAVDRYEVTETILPEGVRRVRTKFKLASKTDSDRTVRQLLGLDAPTKTEHSGRVQVDATVSPSLDYSRLSSDELRTLRDLHRKAQPGLPAGEDRDGLPAEVTAERVVAGEAKP